MKDKLFKELAQSIKQGGRILRGESKPSRTFKYDDPDVRAIRRRLIPLRCGWLLPILLDHWYTSRAPANTSLSRVATASDGRASAYRRQS